MANARPVARPLSPHLQVFKPIPTMVMSIVHRITGGALYVGTLFVAWWLVAAASGPDYFAFVDGIYQSFIGRLILLGYTWALVHHALGGIRHFIWDLGYGYDKTLSTKMAKLTIIGSLSLTVILWIIGFIVA